MQDIPIIHKKHWFSKELGEEERQEAGMLDFAL
jgi:hypothetical protein